MWITHRFSFVGLSNDAEKIYSANQFYQLKYVWKKSRHFFSIVVDLMNGSQANVDSFFCKDNYVGPKIIGFGE